VLTVENLVVYYGRVAGVRGVTLEVAEGEIVGLLGPNGAGKSTTLGAIAGLVKPHSGRLRFDEHDLTGMAAENIVRAGIALVPENRRIFGNLTVQENLQLGATIRSDRDGVREDMARIFERFPVLERLARTAAGNLSGGEQQQLAIGRALLSRPKLLLLDEPSLGLAPILVERVFEAVAELRDEGVTVLLAEQYVAKTLELADRIYSLNKGAVAFSGTAADVRGSTDFETSYLLGLNPAAGTGTGAQVTES
jgi:branched-chain amino acid transport system ATP-binding protein